VVELDFNLLTSEGVNTYSKRDKGMRFGRGEGGGEDSADSQSSTFMK